MKLSPAAAIVLARSAACPDRLLEFHRKLPPATRHKMIDAMLRDALITETQGDYRLGDGSTLVEDAATGLLRTTLAISDAGFRALNLEPPASAEPGAADAPTVQGTGAGVEAATEAPTTAQAATDAETEHEPALTAEPPVAAPAVPIEGSKERATLRQVAAAVVAAWDDESNPEADPLTSLQGPIAALRELLAGRAARITIAGPRKPREGTKQQAVLTLLRRTEGATVTHVMEATGWASHTVRGFFAGLKKKGIAVEAMERVRQVGPDKQGAKGSFTIYHVAAG